MSASAFVHLADGRVQAQLLERIAREVALVDEELERRVESEVGLVREVGVHTLRAGGKRLRPALVTLVALATGLPFDPERTRKLGACMELIHMATLVHDDVIDHSATRRGVATAAAVFGNTASILSGDVLLSKAMAILAEDGDIAIIRNVSKAVVDLAEGEVRELASRGVFELSRTEHFEILRQKTATFIQSCCEVGALATGASDIVVTAAGEFGYHLGMAFQIADDLLDYRASQEATGKPRAADFREGCATLPLILLLPSLTTEERDQTKAKFGNGVSDEEVKVICEWMESRGAFGLAENEGLAQVADAKKALDAFPASDEHLLLETVADMVVQRKS